VLAASLAPCFAVRATGQQNDAVHWGVTCEADLACRHPFVDLDWELGRGWDGTALDGSARQVTSSRIPPPSAAAPGQAALFSCCWLLAAGCWLPDVPPTPRLTQSIPSIDQPTPWLSDRGVAVLQQYAALIQYDLDIKHCVTSSSTTATRQQKICVIHYPGRPEPPSRKLA
jgi:hypothetical protein